MTDIDDATAATLRAFRWHIDRFLDPEAAAERSAHRDAYERSAAALCVLLGDPDRVVDIARRAFQDRMAVAR